MTRIGLCAVGALVVARDALALALPPPQAAFSVGEGGDAVFGIAQEAQRPTKALGKGWEGDWNWTVVNEIDPLKHLSAISPFYIPTASPDGLPPGCELERASLLVRHSSIMGNDDEYEQTMQPFIEKVYGWQRDDAGRLPQEGEWSWLKGWKCPITEDSLEAVSEQGKEDAEVWTASSSRDIDTAKAYIKGGFPSHQSGPDGHGDGEIVQLVKVPNKARDWDRSLTPHKACDAFEKETSLEPANKWLAVYAPRVRERLRGSIPDIVDDLTDQDVLAMQMLCGYETIAQGHSPFCHVFTDDEWLDVEYYFDVRFHRMMGYDNPLSPYLGMPWVKTAAHLLDGGDSGGDDDSGHAGGVFSWSNKGDKKLPKPKLPPNATHTQLLHPSFTHRESPAFVAVFLNLYNHSSLDLPASAALPLDHRADERAWRTSHLVSFLGHVALERFSCPVDKWHQPPPSPGGDEVASQRRGSRRAGGAYDSPSVAQDREADVVSAQGTEAPAAPAQHKRASFVRAVVNGKQERMAGCEDGVGHACAWDTFEGFVQERAERWGDWESVCDKKE